MCNQIIFWVNLKTVSYTCSSSSFSLILSLHLWFWSINGSPISAWESHGSTIRLRLIVLCLSLSLFHFYLSIYLTPPLMIHISLGLLGFIDSLFIVVWFRLSDFWVFIWVSGSSKQGAKDEDSPGSFNVNSKTRELW